MIHIDFITIINTALAITLFAIMGGISRYISKYYNTIFLAMMLIIGCLLSSFLDMLYLITEYSKGFMVKSFVSLLAIQAVQHLSLFMLSYFIQRNYLTYILLGSWITVVLTHVIKIDIAYYIVSLLGVVIVFLER